SNVIVNSPGSNQVITLKDGSFTLEFPQRRVGDRVHLTFRLDGYVVVNDIQLEPILPGDPDGSPLTILVSKPESRDEMARRFYRVKGLEAVERVYEIRMGEMKDANNAEISKLRSERDQARELAEKTAAELAKTRLADASGLNREALQFFLAGDVTSAV